MLRRPEVAHAQVVGILETANLWGRWIFMLLLGFNLGTSFAIAQDSIPKRSVNLEWEDTDEADSYQLEFRKYADESKLKDPIIFKTKKSSSLSAKLVPGRYQLRMRSVDIRGIPGEWGEPSVFVVQLPAPTPKEPASNFAMKTTETKEERVKFSWESVVGASEYVVKVYNQKKEVVAEERTSDSSTKINLPVAQNYSWEVRGVLNGDLGDPGRNESLVIFGGALPPPEIEESHPSFVKELRWSKVEGAGQYEYVFESYKEKEKKWVKVGQAPTPLNGLKFKNALKTGEYRLAVRSADKYRVPSDFTQKQFSVDYDPRGPASVEEARIERSIENPKRTYALAQYIISVVNYTGVNADRFYTKSNFNAVGGTGRLGLGHWLKDSSLGVLGSAEMSGFSVGGQTFQYLSGQLDVGYKQRLGTFGQGRVWLGAQYRELPEVIGEAGTGAYQMEKITNAGPHLSFIFLKGLTPKFGININSNFFYSAMATKTPTGAGNIPRLSYMMGLLGSLKLNDNWVGFAGYAYRYDSAAYFGTTDEAQLGDRVNLIEITGHYINLMLQWGL